ncbi:unnamed protein product, partial [Acidithrix sp. C25]
VGSSRPYLNLERQNGSIIRPKGSLLKEMLAPFGDLGVVELA